MFIERENYFFIEEFEKFGINAIFTKKNAGNMALEVLGEPEKALENRKVLLKKFDKSIDNLFFSKQIHSDNICVIKSILSEKSLEGYDGFVTNIPEAMILMKFADCLPVFFYDRESEAFGMAHSGWKGSQLNISGKIIDVMEKEYGTKRENLLVGIGIGMKGCCYEVSENFIDNFKSKYDENLLAKVFSKRDGKVYFDNENFNYELLKDAGIADNNIIKAGICTGCSGKFFSYRNEKEKSGRNAGIIFKT